MEVPWLEGKWLFGAVVWPYGLWSVLGGFECGPGPVSLFLEHVLGIHLNVYQVRYLMVVLCVFGYVVVAHIHMTCV